MRKNKKPTPLEALKELRKINENSQFIHQKFCNYHLDIIETALKDYEHLQETRYVIIGGRCNGKSCKVDILLKLKALEIINKKNVDVLRIKITENVERYNNHKIKGCRNLTQTEYGLLKEALL